MTLFLILLIVLVAAPTVSWYWKSQRPALQRRREYEELRSRFDRDSKLDVPDFFQAEALAQDLIDAENEGLVNLHLAPSGDARAWYYRQLLLTNPSLYHQARKTLKSAREKYESASDEYRTNVRLYRIGTARLYISEKPLSMLHFEQAYPEQAEKIYEEEKQKQKDKFRRRFEAEVDAERKTIEDKKTEYIKTWAGELIRVDNLYDL